MLFKIAIIRFITSIGKVFFASPNLDFLKGDRWFQDNIYEAISIISKRTIQINESIKKELLDKLEEFASPTESLDEIFENKEQIEVSKFYEKLPKAHAMAVENWLNEKIYFRNTEIKE